MGINLIALPNNKVGIIKSGLYTTPMHIVGVWDQIVSFDVETSPTRSLSKDSVETLDITEQNIHTKQQKRILKQLNKGV